MRDSRFENEVKGVPDVRAAATGKTSYN